MDPYVPERESTVVPGFTSMDVQPKSLDGNYALEENIPAAGHLQETNRLIGVITQKQFHHMNEESDHAATIYQKGSMQNRGAILPKEKTQKIANYVNLLTSNFPLWRQIVQENIQEANFVAENDRLRHNIKEYWGHIKDNFASMLKKLQDLSHHST